MRTVRTYGMRLNPTKCTFGVKSGKFIGYMVTERGIEVNPLKVAVSRFVSRQAERGLYFFKVLRKGGAFDCGAVCQQEFEQLKEFLASLPLLKQPEMGYPLFDYMSMGEESISAVAVREDGKDQCPVYFVSQVMHGAELRYSEVEKVALAQVNAARRLRPYFLNYTMIVRTDHPLSTILGRADTSERLVKWAMELGQFDIHNEPRTAIKAQALADFIQETTRTIEEKDWELYVE